MIPKWPLIDPRTDPKSPQNNPNAHLDTRIAQLSLREATRNGRKTQKMQPKMCKKEMAMKNLKCCIKKDNTTWNMSESSFPSRYKWRFWHQKRVISRAIRVRLTRFLHGSIALSVLFKIGFRVSIHFYWHPPQKKMTGFCPKKAQKPPKR